MESNRELPTTTTTELIDIYFEKIRFYPRGGEKCQRGQGDKKSKYKHHIRGKR